MRVTIIGMGLAKHIFQVHGIAVRGDVVYNHAIGRSQFDLV